MPICCTFPLVLTKLNFIAVAMIKMWTTVQYSMTCFHVGKWADQFNALFNVEVYIFCLIGGNTRGRLSGR